MATPHNILFRTYHPITHCLAFYPTLIAVGFFLLCLLRHGRLSHPSKGR